MTDLIKPVYESLFAFFIIVADLVCLHEFLFAASTNNQPLRRQHPLQCLG
ncbi:MAG: hypothetical protein QM781_02460 [Chitinophagaceae bacterium]